MNIQEALHYPGQRLRQSGSRTREGHEPALRAGAGRSAQDHLAERNRRIEASSLALVVSSTSLGVMPTRRRSSPAKTSRSIWAGAKCCAISASSFVQGEVLGIIGPNGAGKTSLLEILSGRYRPEDRQSLFSGRDITDLSLFERARLGIGRTYQTPLVPEELTVGETFKAARQAFRPWLTRFDAEYGADLVHFTVPYDRPTVSLKTFERRKLLLACLLMRQPKVLLMDEPAAGLINAEIDEIDQILRMLSKEMNDGDAHRRASDRTPRIDRRPGHRDGCRRDHRAR